MKVFIEPIQKEDKNGDRAVYNTNYRDYNIHIVKDGMKPNKNTILYTIEGYDNFCCCIIDKQEVIKDAEEFAQNLITLLDLEYYEFLDSELKYSKIEKALSKLTKKERQLLGLE